MMNAPLERLIAQDRMYEIVEVLTPVEVWTVHLLMSGYNQEQVAEHFGVTASTISRRLTNAQERIIRELPDVARAFSGRSRRRGKRHRRKGDRRDGGSNGNWKSEGRCGENDDGAQPGL